MYIRLDQARFLKSLSRVQRVVERRNTLAIISNVLLIARDNAIELKATDLDIELHEKLNADIREEGVLATQAHLLYEIIRKLPAGREVELFCKDGKQLVLKSGCAQFSLPCCSGEEFPKFGTAEFAHNFVLPAKDLKTLIDKTLFAASTEETRYYLNGICFHIRNKEGGSTAELCAVATDGHRLARQKLSAPPGSEGIPQIIVPRKTMSELQKLLVDQAESSVKIELCDVKIRFTLDSIVMTSKLIDGIFPNYEKVIPFQNEKLVIVSKEAFASAVDLVATIANERSRAVKLYFYQDSIKLEVANEETARAEEVVSCQYSGDELTIGFNAYYLLDIVAQIEGSSIKMLLSSLEKPALISEEKAGEGLYVLMPMRI